MFRREGARLDHSHGLNVQGSDSRLVDRLMFFTDAVFAIVLTLLILELRPPEEVMASNRALKAELTHIVPYVFAFTGSFALVGIFWFAHLQMTRNMKTFDWPVAFANMLFLFTITFMPFTTALAATQGWLAVSFQLYAWNIVAASASQMLLFALETRGNGRLVGGIHPRDRAYRLIRAASPGLAFLTSLAMSMTTLQSGAFYGILTMPLFFLMAYFVKPKAETKSN
jgi:uncharacterized membrane protein